MTAGRWPTTLWLVRHGESAGNVARDAAHAANAHRIDISGRDVDVPLSPHGEKQARALGEWFSRQSLEARPDVLFASPYRRAVQTAQIFRDAGGVAADLQICIDERMREKEFGILDGLTTAGIAQLLPEQAEFREILGKFYHRPPGGESWCDVILRLRSLLDTIALHHAGQRLMIVAHQVVVLCLRYVIEQLTEEDILAIDKAGDVANCSVTEYRLTSEGRLGLVRYNAIEHIEAAPAATVTAEVDRPKAVRG